MESNSCTGRVSSLRGESVLFTGTLRINGEHVRRSVLREFATAWGGDVAPDRSLRITVLVDGDTWSGPLHDENRRYSKKAVFVERVERTTGHHVHVIDAAGFSELMHGRPAPCHQLRAPTG